MKISMSELKDGETLGSRVAFEVWSKCDHEMAPHPEKPGDYICLGCGVDADTLDAYCEKHGHDLEAESDIGPDSGSESIWCKRCGEEWNNIYY